VSIPQMRIAIRVAAIAVLIGVVASCEDQRAIATEPVGDRAFGVGLAVTPNIPAGTARFALSATTPANDTVRFTVTGLDSLYAPFYTVWVGDSLGVTFKRAAGTLQIITTDTVVNAQGEASPLIDTVNIAGPVSTFQNGGMGRQITFIMTRASAGLTATDPLRTLLVTVEQSATAATPGGRRPLWARRVEGVTPALRFGTYHANPDSQYVYVATGRGRAIWRSDIMIINDSALTRPPAGYFYASFMVQRDTLGLLSDTLFLGAQTTPFPDRQSLLDADSIIVDERYQTLTPPAIAAASNRLQADTVPALVANRQQFGAPFAGFAQVLITLELKNNETGEERLGPAIVLKADVPGVIRFSGTQ
jgi:hypothetical protein